MSISPKSGDRGLGRLIWLKYYDDQKKIIILKKPTTVQICKLENIESESMKQVSYSGKYSLSASTARQSHLQVSFVVGNAFSTIIKYLHT